MGTNGNSFNVNGRLKAFNAFRQSLKSAMGEKIYAGEAGYAAYLGNLMALYQKANVPASDEFVVRLSPILIRFLSRPYYTRSQTEDLVQECWLQIHLARHTFRPESPLLPWVFAIARHVRCKAYRRQLRIGSHEFAMDPLPEPPAPKAAGEDSLLANLLSALELLPGPQREVLLLSKVRGMSTVEIAQATRSSVGAVKQRTHRAYRTMRTLHPRAGSPGS